MAAQVINVGDKVRSYSFVGEDSCYIEGVVEAIVSKPDCDHYKIKVDKRVWEGVEDTAPRFVPNDDYSYPPVNGAQTTFGRTVNRVMRIS